MVTVHTWKACPQDGSDVLIVLVLVNLDCAHGMQNQHGVVAARRDIRDHRICALPKSQVLAITKVVLDIDETFTRISVCKYEADTSDLGHTLGQQVDLCEGTVIGD